MVSSINNSSQALSAYGTAFNVTSNNIANVQSDEFKSTKAVFNEGDNGSGVKVTLTQNNAPGPLVNQDDGTLKELSNTDLAREMTDMITQQTGYEANVKAVQTDDEMKGIVIDMVA